MHSLKHPDAKKLRATALKYPTTTEDFPWDHHAYKVGGKKVFLFLTALEAGGFNCTMKLPYRHEEALQLKGAAPTGYGMSRTGWVTFTYAAKDKPPAAKLADYLDESWRAIAPKKLSENVPAPLAASVRKRAPV